MIGDTGALVSVPVVPTAALVITTTIEDVVAVALVIIAIKLV
jgi:hypothetical protein